MAPRLNQVQVQILAALQENPRMSISELSQRVDVSRPTVIKTFKELIEQDLILISAGLNAQTNNYLMANLGLRVNTPNRRAQIVDILKKCPKVMNIYRINDQANLLVEICGPDETSITSTINCIGDLDQVEIKYTQHLGAPLTNLNIPIGIGDNTNTPCGKNCFECVNNENEWCNGCFTNNTV